MSMGLPVNPVIEVKLGGVWTDFTARARQGTADSGGGLSIKRGRPNEAPIAEASEFTLVLDNADKALNELNPTGDYYGKLKRNLPIRMGLNRRIDNFDHVETSSWGRMPTWTDTANVVQNGDVWSLAGGAAQFNVASSEATIQAVSGYQAVYAGVYADVSVRARMKVSNRNSEFGLVMRGSPVAVSGQADGDFESGTAGWVATGGALSTSTAQFKTGAASAMLTVSGSPTKATVKTTGLLAVLPGQSYRLRTSVRSSATAAIQLELDWYDKNGVFLSTSTSTSLAASANTWYIKEHTVAAPTDAVFVKYGPAMTGSPANGTLMFLDEVVIINITSIAWYTAYVTPGTTDQARIGKIVTGTYGSVSRSFNANLASNVVAGSYYWVYAQIAGQRIRMKIWPDDGVTPEPDAWSVSYTDTVTVAEGQVPRTGGVGAFTKDGDALLSVSSIQIDQWRVHAEIVQMPPRTDLSRKDKWVPVAAAGILRRLGQGRKDQESAVTHHLRQFAGSSSLWIPLEEEGDDKDRASSALTGGRTAISTLLTFQSPETTGPLALPGVSMFAHLGEDTSKFVATAPSHPDIGKWTILFFFKIPNVVASNTYLFTVNASGTAKTYRGIYRSDGALQIDVTDVVGTVLSTTSANLYFSGIPQGSWIAATVYAFNNGGNVNWAFNFHQPGGSGFYTLNGSFAGVAGIFSGISFKSNSVLTAAGGLDIAQVFHYQGDLPFVTASFADASAAYVGELSTTRFLRQTLDAGIKGTLIGAETDGEPMGAQLPGKLLDNLADCALAEMGILEEGRDDFELILRTRRSIYNSRECTMGIDTGHLTAPLDPTPDDQGTRNYVKAQRTNGGFATSIKSSGSMNVNAPEADPDGIGLYDEAPTFNVEADSQLQPIADWRVALGTQTDPRYPSMNAQMGASLYLADPVQAALAASLDSGSLVRLYNSEATPDAYAQLIQSYTEKINDQYEQDFSWVATPGGLYIAPVVGSSFRVDAAAATTAASFLSGTDTEIQSSGSTWVQIADSPASFPLKVKIAGVVLRVLTVGRNLSTNPYFETDTSGWQADGANFAIAQDRQYQKEGSYSMRVTCSASATGGAIVTAAAQNNAVAGSTYRISGWIRTSTAVADIRLAVDWYQSNGTTFISTGSPTAIATSAGVWTHFSASLVAPALTGKARLKVRAVATTGDVVWVDKVLMIEETTASGSPQILVVEQTPLNGVIKTIPSGSQIKIADPSYITWRNP